jgi:hypothetical protein
MPAKDLPPWAAGVPIIRLEEHRRAIGMRYEVVPHYEVNPPVLSEPRGPGRPNTLTPARRRAVEALLAQSPRPSQRRLAAELAERFRVHERTVRRWLVLVGQNSGTKPTA